MKPIARRLEHTRSHRQQDAQKPDQTNLTEAPFHWWRCSPPFHLRCIGSSVRLPGGNDSVHAAQFFPWIAAETLLDLCAPELLPGLYAAVRCNPEAIQYVPNAAHNRRLAASCTNFQVQMH